MPRSGVALTALAFLLATFGLAARQSAPAAVSARNASYALSATLDPVNRLILGSGRLTWRNTSSIATSELRFHLYWNSWRQGSSWMRAQALRGNTEIVGRADADRGSIDLTTLKLVGSGADLLGRARLIAPDDNNLDDRTVLSVPLDRPIRPGETIELDLGWNAHVPRPAPQVGARGPYFFIGHWFPQIGVLDADGWVCHQVRDTRDDVSDFGIYDVRLTVPAGWTVGATGRGQGVVDDGHGMRTHRFVEQDLRDFAWTASPDFLTEERRFERAGLPAVLMRLLLQPEHADQADRYFAATSTALRSYGAWFGPYPYDYITIVDPLTALGGLPQDGPIDAAPHPTLIVGGTRWSAAWKAPLPELETIRDAGRQFLTGRVAPRGANQVTTGESLTAYLSAKALADGFSDRYFAKVERYLGGFVWWTYEDVLWTRDLDGYATGAQGLPDRGALWIATLERLVGWDTMQAILATYVQRYTFARATPDAFPSVAAEVSKQDLRWFFDAMHRDQTTFDYAVTQVTSQPTETGALDNAVVVRRLGDGVFPVDVRVTFADGASVIEHWDGRDVEHVFRYRRGSVATTAFVDPDHVLLLDANFTNNSWTAQPQAHAASSRWALRWLIWFEDVLLTYAFLA